MKRQYRGILFACYTAILWGVLAIVLKVTLSGLSPITVTWVRFFIAFICLLGYYLCFKPKALAILIRPPTKLVFAAIFLGLNYLGFITGIKYTTPGIAQIFIQLGPVLLIVSGYIFFGEKSSIRQIAGLILVFSGLSLFYYNQIIIVADDFVSYQRGVLYIIFGALMWAAYAIFQKSLVKSYDPTVLNLFLFGFPALCYTPFASYQSLYTITYTEAALLIFLGLNTFFAYIFLSHSLKYLDTNKVSVIITLNPIITFLIMFVLEVAQVRWICYEKITGSSVLGGSVVILGALLTIMPSKKRSS